QEAAIAGARDGGAAEHGAELVFTERRQLLERRREFARLVCRIARDGGAAVPGADVLANVAAEDVTAHGAADRLRDGIAELDREVGNAEARVHGVAGASAHDGFGGTGLYAAAARAAAIGRRRIGSDFDRDEQFAQEEPRAGLLVDQAGVPADPAQAGQPCIRALQKGRRIHTDL